MGTTVGALPSELLGLPSAALGGGGTEGRGVGSGPDTVRGWTGVGPGAKRRHFLQKLCSQLGPVVSCVPLTPLPLDVRGPPAQAPKALPSSGSVLMSSPPWA